MKARDLMNEPKGHCTPQTPLAEVARMMVECDCGAIPVVESEKNQRLLGVVTDRDIVVRLLAQDQNPLEKTAEDCMTRDVHTVSPETDEAGIAHLMEQYRVRRVPVVDENGICCGIISQADFAGRAPGEETAEILREVSKPAAPHS